ncbi:hypothetical protein ACFUVV_28240 [Streptomyces sp. NPDC057376]|uniref:hypothetical protein n=1 Tax=unclassified Streptomyces TaxID=2593676 RepID=UPI000A578ABC
MRLTGFVTRDDDGTWYVIRLREACCAAGSAAAWPPVLDATDARPIAEPADPYEER